MGHKLRTIRTSEKVGRFYVYRYGDLEWWRCPHGFGPAWYVCVIDENGKQIMDGEYIETNPADSPEWHRTAYFGHIPKAYFHHAFAGGMA